MSGMTRASCVTPAVLGITVIAKDKETQLMTSCPILVSLGFALVVEVITSLHR